MSEPPLNLYDAALEGNPDDPAGYRKRKLAFGAAIGGDRLGGSIYEVDPGDSLYPYHYEGVEEEWLLVLAGTPTLRDPEGEHELAPGDILCFRPGPEGAHKIVNRSAAAVRLAMFSTVPPARRQHLGLPGQRQGRGLALARQAPDDERRAARVLGRRGLGGSELGVDGRDDRVGDQRRRARRARAA